MKKIFTIICFITTAYIASADISTISVTGTGVVSAKPDTFSIIATVETIDDNSKKAISKNIDIVNTSMELLEKLNLKEKTLKTENYSLNYRSDYNSKDNKMKYYVQNQLYITSSDLERASDVLTALNDAGVNNIGNIEFYISDRKNLEDIAYKIAYENAKNRAGLIAELENYTVTPKEINLTYSYPRVMGFASTSTGKLDGTPVPITIPNDLDVSASMNVIFYMIPKQ